MDNICKICGENVLEDSHYYKSHKLKIADYHKKYFARFDLFTKEPIVFKSKDSYFLTDFNDKRNLKKYLESISKEEGLNYLKNWLLRRKEFKGIDFAPMEFEAKSLCFPSINFIEKYYGQNSYKKICEKIPVQFKCDYNNPPLFNRNINNRDFICDTREQEPISLPNMKVAKLNFGDYTLEKSNIFVERKSLNDALGTLSQGYERFKREVQRCKENTCALIVLIEEKYSNLQSFEYMPHVHSKCTWAFISHRIRELIQEYPLHIQFLCVDGRKEAARVIEKIFKCENNFIGTDFQYWYGKGIL